MTRVGVFGAAGKMGTAVCRAVHEADGLELVAAVDPFAAGRSVGELVPGIDLVITESPQALLDAGAEVVVDFTVLEAARAKIADLSGQVADLHLSVESLEKERDFYFGKLRDIEILLQTYTGPDAQTASEITKILYATDDDFVAVDDGGQPVAAAT